MVVKRIRLDLYQQTQKNNKIMNTTFNFETTENATITELAQAQFHAEDKLERDFSYGFITEQEYNEGLMAIYYTLEDLMVA